MNALRDQGFSVSHNTPYAGVELVRRYADPNAGCHSVQIEVNRALYMHEDRHELHEGFDEIRGALNEVVSRLAHEAVAADAAE